MKTILLILSAIILFACKSKPNALEPLKPNKHTLMAKPTSMTCNVLCTTLDPIQKRVTGTVYYSTGSTSINQLFTDTFRLAFFIPNTTYVTNDLQVNYVFHGLGSTNAVITTWAE